MKIVFVCDSFAMKRSRLEWDGGAFIHRIRSNSILNPNFTKTGEITIDVCPVATAHAEVERWIAFKVSGYNFSAGLQSLQWWRESNVFPRIRGVAQLFMGAPATSASSERVWSTAKRVCGGERSRMTPEHMQSLVRLHENLRRTSSLFKSVAADDTEDDADLCDAEEQKVRDKHQFRVRK